MGQGMRISDVVERLFDLDSEETIYAAEPWTDQSGAMLAREPDSGGLPPEVIAAGLQYFLEVSVAKEFVEDWLSSQNKKPEITAICRRLIEYATNDA